MKTLNTKRLILLKSVSNKKKIKNLALRDHKNGLKNRLFLFRSKKIGSGSITGQVKPNTTKIGIYSFLHDVQQLQ